MAQIINCRQILGIIIKNTPSLQVQKNKISHKKLAFDNFQRFFLESLFKMGVSKKVPDGLEMRLDALKINIDKNSTLAPTGTWSNMMKEIQVQNSLFDSVNDHVFTYVRDHTDYCLDEYRRTQFESHNNFFMERGYPLLMNFLDLNIWYSKELHHHLVTSMVLKNHLPIELILIIQPLIIELRRNTPFQELLV